MAWELTHEQLDQNVIGLVDTYVALRDLNLTPEGLTDGNAQNSVLYGYGGRDSGEIGLDLGRARRSALESLRFDVGCWARVAYESDLVLDTASEAEMLEQVGFLAMMTVPHNSEEFYRTATSLRGLLESVVQKKPISITTKPSTKNPGSVEEIYDHEGNIRVTFENGHISSRTIDVWSNRPDKIHATEPVDGSFPQVHFPLFSLDLDDFASGKIVVEPTPESAAA